MCRPMRPRRLCLPRRPCPCLQAPTHEESHCHAVPQQGGGGGSTAAAKTAAGLQGGEGQMEAEAPLQHVKRRERGLRRFTIESSLTLSKETVCGDVFKLRSSGGDKVQQRLLDHTANVNKPECVCASRRFDKILFNISAASQPSSTRTRPGLRDEVEGPTLRYSRSAGAPSSS